MARTRDIKPSFFKNEYLAECDPLARLLFVGLWTIADRDGRIECRPLRIKAELFPYENCDIVALLEQLRVRGFVRCYQFEGVRYIDIPGFVANQRPHPKEQSEGHPAWELGENVDFHGEKCNAAASSGNAAASSGKTTASREKVVASCALPSFPSLSSLPSVASLHPSDVATTSSPKRRARSQPSDSILWSTASGWEGITDEDRSAWRLAYPACDLAGELARMTEWLKANPAKAHKSNWRAFVTKWLTRSQDRGGGAAPSKPSTSQAAKAWWRPDAGENMTEARYQAWRASRRLSGHAVALAAALKAP